MAKSAKMDSKIVKKFFRKFSFFRYFPNMVSDRDKDRPRLTERDFDSMSRSELWQAYQKLER